jgi:hypothetical protein
MADLKPLREIWWNMIPPKWESTYSTNWDAVKAIVENNLEALDTTKNKARNYDVDPGWEGTVIGSNAGKRSPLKDDG